MPNTNGLCKQLMLSFVMSYCCEGSPIPTVKMKSCVVQRIQVSFNYVFQTLMSVQTTLMDVTNSVTTPLGAISVTVTLDMN